MSDESDDTASRFASRPPISPRCPHSKPPCVMYSTYRLGRPSATSPSASGSSVRSSRATTTSATSLASTSPNRQARTKVVNAIGCHSSQSAHQPHCPGSVYWTNSPLRRQSQPRAQKHNIVYCIVDDTRELSALPIASFRPRVTGSRRTAICCFRKVLGWIVLICVFRPLFFFLSPSHRDLLTLLPACLSLCLSA